MNQPSAAQSAESLLREDNELGVAVANLKEQLEAAQDRRKQVRAAIEGIKIGQALAAEIAAADAAKRDAKVEEDAAA